MSASDHNSAEFSRRDGPRLAIASVLVYIGIWILNFSRQFATNEMTGFDGPYHIKLAWIYANEGFVGGSFRWAQFSLWRDSFFDKEFGFHVLMMPFTGLDLTLGAKLAAVTFASLTFVSLYLILRITRVRHPLFWVVVLCGTGLFFGWRIIQPRPHVVSVTLSLWSLFFVIRRSWIGTGIVGLVYSLCYTAPLVVVVYALIGFAMYCVMHRQWDWRPLAAGTGGVLLGWLVHPHFPNNFRFVWIQIVDVLFAAWGGSAEHMKLGTELAPRTTDIWLREHFLLYGLTVIGLLVASRARGLLTPRFLTVFLITNLWFIMTCLSHRFVEYWVPMMVWTLAEVYSAAWPSIEAQAKRVLPSRRIRYVAAVPPFVILIAAVVWTQVGTRKDIKNLRHFDLEPAALWLKHNVPRHSTIFTCDFDDSPQLFFHDHHHQYLVFLDPNFMYRWNRDTWNDWVAIANGRRQKPAEDILVVFGTRFGVCTNDFTALRRQLERDPGVRVTPKGPAYVFEIKADATNHPRSGTGSAPGALSGRWQAMNSKVPTHE